MAAAKKPVAKKAKKTEIMPEEAIENTNPIEVEDIPVDNVDDISEFNEREAIVNVEESPVIEEEPTVAEPVEGTESEVEPTPEPEVESNPEAEPEPVPETPVKEEKKEEPKEEKKPEAKKPSPKLRTSYNHMGMIYSW